MDNLVKYYDHNEFSFISMEKLEELEDEIFELYKLNLLKEEMQNEEINKNNQI